jgi:hypothetical protein
MLTLTGIACGYCAPLHCDNRSSRDYSACILLKIPMEEADTQKGCAWVFMAITANLCIVGCFAQLSKINSIYSSERAYTNVSVIRIGQEILVSRRIMIHNTQAQIQWERFGAAVRKRPKTGKTVLDIWQSSNPEYFWNLWNDRRSTRHSQDRHHNHPDYHPIWSLLTRLFMSQCADQRDRIYSLLAVVEDGEGFDVSYSETPVALFWRAGEHFGAWARPAFVSALRQALDVSLPELNDSLKQHTHLEITIPVRLSTSRSVLRMFASKVKCAHKECRKQHCLPSKSRQDISLCARIDAKECQDIQCVHILVHPATNARQGFELTLAAPPHNRFPGFTKRLDSVALQYHTNCTWQEVDSWEFIEQSMKRSRLKGRWRLKLSPALIVEHLKIMSESSSLTHDEVD